MLLRRRWARPRWFGDSTPKWPTTLWESTGRRPRHGVGGECRPIAIDTNGFDSNNREPAQYDLDVFAAVDNQVLGGATVRFNWTAGTP